MNSSAIAVFSIIGIGIIVCFIIWACFKYESTHFVGEPQEDDDYMYIKDFINDRVRKMNMKEQIDYLRLKVKEYEEKYEQMTEEHEKYMKALCFLNKFKFEDINNKMLRKETETHCIETDKHFYLLPGITVKSVVDNLDNFSKDKIIEVYDYIKQQLKKDNELAMYNGKIKTNSEQFGVSCIASAITPCEKTTKSKPKKKKKTSKKK